MAIFFETVSALFTAFYLRTLRRNCEIRLPALIKSSSPLPGQELSRIVRKVDWIIKILLFFNCSRCFYRCYALAAILRKRGIPLALNFGWCIPAKNRKIRGHCWLSLDGQAFMEAVDIWTVYPICIGSLNNEIYYWSGQEGSLDLFTGEKLRILSHMSSNITYENDFEHNR